jgi:hypothetical protein
VRRQIVIVACAAVLLAGCGSSAAPPTATPAPAPTATSPSTSTTQPTAGPQASATPAVSATYRAFVTALCHDLAKKNSKGVQGDLPYYQYNSGLRWGMMGDGLGQTDDPSLMNTWLSAGNPACKAFTPDIAGHGTVLAGGWTQPGPWSLIELDVYPGKHWKINDFTFGSESVLRNAMRTAGPALPITG